MELPTSNRKKVIDIWLTGLVAKIDPFSIFWKVISRKPLDLHRWKFAQIFFQTLSASVPNFIEIGGGSRKFSKKLVDLTRNDPLVLDLEHSSTGLLFLEVFVYLTNHRWDVWNVFCHPCTIIMFKTVLYKKGTAKCSLTLCVCHSTVTRFTP